MDNKSVGCGEQFGYGEQLRRRIWITKGSRFEASRKLSFQGQLSITSISFLSVYAIAISIIQNTVDSTSQCSNLNNLYTITAILLSVFILVLSLLEGLKNYQLRAERLYNNAKELSQLYKKLKFFLSCLNLEVFTENDPYEFIYNIQKQYDDLIDRCQENHDPDDYWLFKAKKLKCFSEDFEDRYYLFKDRNYLPKIHLRSWWIQIAYTIKHYWLYIISIFFPVPIFWWLYSIFKC